MMDINELRCNTCKDSITDILTIGCASVSEITNCLLSMSLGIDKIRRMSSIPPTYMGMDGLLSDQYVYIEKAMKATDVLNRMLRERLRANTSQFKPYEIDDNGKPFNVTVRA